MIIDVTRLIGRFVKGFQPTGVDRVDLEYVNYISNASALLRIGRFWIFFDKKISFEIFKILINRSSKYRWMILFLLFKWIVIFLIKPNKIRDSILLNISHSGLEHDSYSYNIKKYQLKAIFFIHDLIPIEYPEYSRIGEKQKHINRLNTAIKSGYKIIVNSKDTSKKLSVYAQKNSLDLPEIVVSHLGIKEFIPKESSQPLVEHYFIMIGTIEARKNHLIILNVLREIIKEFGEKAPKLVIIGRRGWECENVIDMLERCDALQPYVLEIPKCNDTQLAEYLFGAQALLMPSFAEGYGIPVLEAISHKIPVIASDLNVFREIAGNIPEYISPLDAIGWKKMILEYCDNNSIVRNAQIKRMNDFKCPTWNAHFEILNQNLVFSL